MCASHNKYDNLSVYVHSSVLRQISVSRALVARLPSCVLSLVLSRGSWLKVERPRF